MKSTHSLYDDHVSDYDKKEYDDLMEQCCGTMFIIILILIIISAILLYGGTR